MRYSIRQLLKAGIIAPLAIVPVSLLCAIWDTISSIGELIDPENDVGLRPWDWAWLLPLYGIPIAYIVIFAVALPFYRFALKSHRITYPRAVLAAFILCLPIALCDRFLPLTGTYLSLLPFGIPIAALFVRALGPDRP